MATGTGISAGRRPLIQRRRNRQLPQIEVPRNSETPGVSRAFDAIAEHLRVYEGDSAAPKERFVTIQELEDAGLISSQIKNGFSFISKVLDKDVAQTAGSTANATLKGTRKKDTALGSRKPGGGSGGSDPIEQGKRGAKSKLSDIGNVFVASPAQRDFLYYDGGEWRNFPLFKRDNKWLGRQTFQGDVTFTGAQFTMGNFVFDADQTVGAGQDNYVLTYDDSTGLISLEAASGGGISDAPIDGTDYVRRDGAWEAFPAEADPVFLASDAASITASDITNWDTAYGWGDHSGQGYLTDASAPTLTDTWNFSSKIVGPEDSDFSYGIHGAYSNNASTNWAASIWSIDTSWNGGDSGSGWASTGVYGLAWIRDAHSEEDADVGEGLYVFRAGTQLAGFGITGAKLSAGGGTAFYTQLYSSTGHTTAAQVRTHMNEYHDVGLNVLPAFGINTSDTLEARHCGAVTGKTSSTASTLTLAASTDLDFPVDGVATVYNVNNSGNVSVNQGSGTTLRWIDGTGITDGNRTVGPGGIMTIHRYSATLYVCWGAGIS